MKKIQKQWLLDKLEEIAIKIKRIEDRQSPKNPDKTMELFLETDLVLLEIEKEVIKKILIEDDLFLFDSSLELLRCRINNMETKTK